MSRLNFRTVAFSLVEVTLALGVATLLPIAVFGLMPVGIQTNRNATSQTAATSIMTTVVADLRATQKTPGDWRGTSPQFRIPLGTAKTLYFDSEIRCSIDLAGSTSPSGAAWARPLQTRYRMNITFPSTGNLTYADVNVTWPAAATLANASGSVEVFAAFDRN
jgi:uncharacterized protein (TIGR02598 family)